MEMCLETSRQIFPARVFPVVPHAPSVWTFEIRSVDTVGVDQTTEQEAHQQAKLELDDLPAAAESMLQLGNAARDFRDTVGEIRSFDEFCQSGR